MWICFGPIWTTFKFALTVKGPKEFLVQKKYFWLDSNFLQNVFGLLKKFWSKKNYGHNNFGSKTFFGKKRLVQKNFVQKKCLVGKNSGFKIF